MPRGTAHLSLQARDWVVGHSWCGTGSGIIPMASEEGGHCDFAARNEDEIHLLRHLQKKMGGLVKPMSV